MATQALDVEAEGARKRRSTAMDKVMSGLDGGALTDALLGTEEKLNIFQAFRVAFCIAFGAGIALVGWYPMLAGVYGFAFSITLVSISGAIAENALHVTAIKTQAASFADLCKLLPSWTGVLTSLSSISWGFTIAGLYVRYIFSFINDQILARVLESPLPVEGLGSLPLYLPIGVVVYFITLPPSLGGSVIKAITAVNLATTWVVIITAIAKGLYMYSNPPASGQPEEYTWWKPDGMLQVIVLLAGAMFQCTAVPRIQYELQPELRQTASWMLPLLLGGVQGVVFLIVGLIGYRALGNNIEDSGDVFRSYFTVQNDFMVTILQAGIALLMFLSLPLLGVPPKVELWAFISRDESIPFEAAPAPTRAAINAVMIIYATLMPPLLGPGGVTVLVSILAGIAANWMNLFLPCMVTVYADTLPAKEAGQPFIASAAKSVWIFLLASACLYSSVVEIIDLF